MVAKRASAPVKSLFDDVTGLDSVRVSSLRREADILLVLRFHHADMKLQFFQIPMKSVAGRESMSIGEIKAVSRGRMLHQISLR